MKVRIVFTPDDTRPDGSTDTKGPFPLVFTAIVGDDGNELDDMFADCWIADGDVEALELDVLPPIR